jgi:hypothetical protein
MISRFNPMTPRFYVMAIGLFVLLLVLLFAVKKMVFKHLFYEHLHLRTYEAAAGDLSLCANEPDCIKYATEIKSWVCASGVCDGTDKSKRPLDCWGDRLSEYSKQVLDQVDPLMCPLIKFPNAKTRQAVLTHFPGWDVEGEDTLIEYGAYLLAFKGSAASCEDYIKDYVGASGPRWKFKWYRAISGCRIIAGAATRGMEEKDYYTWFKAARGSGNCSGIVNGQLRRACSDPKTAFPLP